MLTKLTTRRGLGMLAVDAATKVADVDPDRGHDLLRELAAMPAPSEVQVAAARTLLIRVPDVGLSLLDHFWNKVSVEPDTRLALARLVTQVSVVLSA